MEGYKIGLSNNKKVLITLLIPDDALTNKNRYTIIDYKHAKYRCNKAYVIDIRDMYNNSYEWATSIYYTKKLLYEKNKIIETEFDTDILIENSKGIHYFIDYDTALNYRIPILYQHWKNESMIYKNYYNNGNIRKKIKYIMGSLENNKTIIYKMIQEYYPNGQIKLDYNLAINKYDSLYREWYENGRIKKRLIYEKNKVISYIENWDMRGIKY